MTLSAFAPFSARLAPEIELSLAMPLPELQNQLTTRQSRCLLSEVYSSPQDVQRLLEQLQQEEAQPCPEGC